MQRSAELFRKRWDEQVTGSFGFGIITLVLLVPALALAGLLFSFDRALAIIMLV
jgi:hypothetical protein